jgi:hypothetical protein
VLTREKQMTRYRQVRIAENAEPYRKKVLKYSFKFIKI